MMNPALRQKIAIALKMKQKLNPGVSAPKAPQANPSMPVPNASHNTMGVFNQGAAELSPRFFSIKNKLKPI